ncbi:PF05638 family protein [Leptospira weilii serovar Ranarum str. ICFT]|uniref:PF05638 family protein n=1 Tax=Leptospira weilii serovar Ranarum str. ICFT TaxID=1218598 RepID=N1WCN9_9LEPT|nr:type VI secretion system tube protein Hcp [Leptospira weilii]EMY78001.1 PF05638 family protein [Leptospira weilii serovar Ranarum str. ICFT]
MFKKFCFLIAILLILPLYAEDIDQTNKMIVKVVDPSQQKEGDKIQFEALSFSHGVSMPLTSDGPSYRPVYQDYTLTKYLDLHSAYWMERCAGGGLIPEVILTYYRRNKAATNYKAMEVHLTNVIVSSFSTGGGGDQPLETVTFSFESIRYSVSVPSSTGKLDTKTFVGKVPKN